MVQRCTLHTRRDDRAFNDDYFTVKSNKVEISNEVEISKKEKHIGYFKAKILDRHNEKRVNENIKESIDNQSIVFTDKSTFYMDIADFVEFHVTEKSNKDLT